MHRQMLLGGRFLQQEFSGEMMGSLYHGIGFTGHDNHTQKYVSTWMETFHVLCGTRRQRRYR